MRFVIVVVALLLLAACNPAEQAQGEDAADTGTQGTPQGNAGGSARDVEVSDENAMEELKELFMKKARLEYMVEYEMSTTTNGESQEMAITQYLKGEKLRSDMQFQGMETRTYFDGDSFTSCSRQNGEWSCFQIQHQETETDALQKNVEEDITSGEDLDVALLPPRTVAGALTSCFRINAIGGSVDYCLSKEGVPLYVKTEGRSGGTTFSSVMEATAYSTSVSNADFEPPAEPSTMPDMGDYADLIAQYS